MKYVNLPAGAARNADVGLVWREVYNGAGGYTFTAPVQGTFRVSAGADVTVTIGGILAMTLRSGEVEVFNAGVGAANNSRTEVEVVIGAGDARVQLAVETDSTARREK